MELWSNARQDEYRRLCATELQLRRGHAEDCLESVRGALIQLSWVFKNKVRGAEGAERTRSYDRVNQLQKLWKLQRRLYNLNRKAMLLIGESGELTARFPELLKGECTVKTAVEGGNQRGQSSHRLPWFWSSDRGGNLPTPNSEHHDECESANIPNSQYLSILVFRVHWLRARAQRSRWAEELVLVQHEMGWTIAYYMHMATIWKTRCDSCANELQDVADISRGQRAYANRLYKQCHMTCICSLIDES